MLAEEYGSIDLKTPEQTVGSYQLGNDGLRPPAEISCRFTNGLIKYLEAQGYDADAFLSGFPHTRQYLTDPLNWVSFETRETLSQKAIDLTGNKAIMYEVGLSSPGLNSNGGLEQMLKLLGDPKLAYRALNRYGHAYNRIIRFQVGIIGEAKALIEMSQVGGHLASKNGCYFTRGMLAAIPTLWGLPPAEVIEKQCMCSIGTTAPEDMKTPRGPVCSYEVTWQPLPPLRRRLWDTITRKNSSISSTVKRLKDNFVILDQRNAELNARNRQLAKVREIALAIDGIRSRDQVYRTVVEMARDIPGVRLILILKEDETREYMVCPYHSRIRHKALLAPLRKIGFDMEGILGDEPASNKVKFKISDSKLAKVYMSSPSVSVMISLADFMDGVRPKIFCDTVQRIVGIKKIAVVPVTVAGEAWGAMVFVLDQEVPTDILEMVGAHCAAAQKNALALEELRRKNEELRQSQAETNSLYEKEKAARQELEEEAKARGMFIDVLAHEMRTPLTSLLPSIALLKEITPTEVPGPQVRLIEIISGSTHAMVQRLEELLEVARYSRGAFKLNIQSVEPVAKVI